MNHIYNTDKKKKNLTQNIEEKKVKEKKKLRKKQTVKQGGKNRKEGKASEHEKPGRVR